MSVITLTEYYSIIDELTEKGSLEQALNHCLYLIRQFPKCLSIYEKCGRIFIENNNYTGAIDVYTRLCAAHPTNYLYHFYLAHVFSQCGKPEQARYHFDTMVCLEQNSEQDAQNLLSMMRLDDVSESIFTEQITFARGVEAFSEEKYIKSIEYFSKGGFGKNDYLAEIFLSQALLRAGQGKEAVNRMERILRDSPRTLPILQTLACYYNEVNPLRFKSLLAALIDLDPFYAHWNIKGNMIYPSEYPINITYFDWTGFPNTRVKIGWQQTSDRFLTSDNSLLPQWLELLPNRSFVRMGITSPGQTHSEGQISTDNPYQQSLFNLMSSAPAKPVEVPETGIPETAEYTLPTDESLVFPPLIIPESEPETIPEPEPQTVPEPQIESEEVPVSAPETGEEPISPEDEIMMLRNAWKCFSMGNQAEGVELYRELIRRNIQPERVRADLQKLLLLFPDNSELQSIIQQ